MYESPDNPASRPDIDGLFQKLARDYEPPFDPAAWQQMQQKLDQLQPPARPFAQVRRLLLLLAVLLVVGSQLQSRPGLGRSVAGRVAEPPCRTTSPASAEPAEAITSAKSLTTKPAPTGVSLLAGPPAEPSRAAGPTRPADVARPGVSEQRMISGTTTPVAGQPVVQRHPDRQFADGQRSIGTTVNDSLIDKRPTSRPFVAKNRRASRPDRLVLANAEAGQQLDRQPRTQPDEPLQADEEPSTKPTSRNKARLTRITDRPTRQRSRPTNTGPMAVPALIATPAPMPTDTNPGRDKIGRNGTKRVQADKHQPGDVQPVDSQQPDSQPTANHPGGNDHETALPPALPPPTVPILAPIVRTDSLTTRTDRTTTPGVVPPTTDLVVVTAMPVRADTAKRVGSQPEPVTDRPMVQKRISLLLLVSPDLTTVGLTNFARPGSNYGLLVEYRLTRRWSVQAGLIQSTKIYNAEAGAYQLPWAPAVPLVGVFGTCKMLDIPINLRFDVLSGKKIIGRTGAATRLFASAGLTTYIMQNEKYDYIYANPYNPAIKYRSWEGTTGRYDFSQFNLSLGYERPLSRHWSVQAEPFAKIPLIGVGYFKVRLVSTGVFLGLRYRF